MHIFLDTMIPLVQTIELTLLCQNGFSKIRLYGLPLTSFAKISLSDASIPRRRPYRQAESAGAECRQSDHPWYITNRYDTLQDTYQRFIMGQEKNTPFVRGKE
jgi:hypothetical protein